MRTLLLLAIAACYESPASLCSDGRACGAGLICNDAAGCVLPEQLAACADKASGDACSYADHPRGVCSNGACVPAGCGNGVVEADEACDDGNTVDGDGCSADCRSDERCGNGVIDGAVGEQCDDGGQLSHDGCSSRCQLEAPSWVARTEHLAISVPTSMAFDPLRRVTVAIANDVTLVWDGNEWTSPGASLALTARDGAALAYDDALGEVIAFGGVFQSNLGDTIAWSGKDWHTISTSAGPPPGSRATIAWDGAHHVAVLVPDDTSRDTWTFDGHAWTRTGAQSPPSQQSAAFACDPRRAVCTWYGRDGSTWEWDGASWTQRTVTGPPARDGAAMIYDTQRRVLVLIGGTIANVPVAETWEWDGSTWTTIAGGPSNTTVATFDPIAGTTFAISMTAAGYALWQRAGTTWTPITETSGFPFSFANSTTRAYDRDRGEIVFGGPETWIWRGTSWSPTAGRSYAAQAALGGGRVGLVRFGGFDAAAAPLGTALWTGSDWNDLVVAQPPFRQGAAASDDVSGGVVIFGGVVGGSYVADSWRWDGAAWTQLPDGPPAFHVSAMAFDDRRGRSVLIGDDESQTWEWDGTAWSSLDDGAFNMQSPPVIIYDANMQKVVNQSLTGTQVFDGTRWQPLLAPLTVQNCSAFVYDAARARGLCDATPLQWTFALDSSGADEVCGSGLDVDGDGLIGCDDPDCWPYCTPWCPPGAACDPAAPHCGDGVCNTALENCRLCPGDCGACTAVCGDFICDPGEDHASCPGDCP